jgi:hypothetical protein
MDRGDPDDFETSSDVTSADDLAAWRAANQVDRGAAEVPTPLQGRAVAIASTDGSVTTGWRLEEVQCSREDHGLQLWAVLQSLDDPGRSRMMAIRSLDDVRTAD